MRFLPIVAVSSALLFAQGSMAEEGLSLERTKTGILPNGGFYSMYAVTCSDQTVAEVASTDRRQRWCARSGAEMACYRNAEEALAKACASAQVAASETVGNEYTN